MISQWNQTFREKEAADAELAADAEYVGRRKTA
jgi:hypothetical protein